MSILGTLAILPMIDNPLDGILPDFSIFGVEFTALWQKILAGLWGLAIVAAVIIMIIGIGNITVATTGGNPSAYNASSGCAGLLQLAPCHYRGRFDPLRPRANLACGLKLWRGSGWQPWTTY